MTLSRLVPVLLFAALAAGSAVAGPRGGGVERVPDAAHGDCQARRVTGPGGAYRYERTKCLIRDEDAFDYDRWAYGRGGLAVETHGGDRYGDRRDGGYAGRGDAYAYAYEQQRRLCGCAGGYDQGRGGPVYPYPSSEPQSYATAGRDDYGWLVWAGKRP